MRRRLFFWEAGGFLLTGLLGLALPFLFRWSGGSPLAAAFLPVNGSVGELMKALFLPVFLYSIPQVCREGRNYPDLLAVRALSLFLALTLAVVLHYTCLGALGVRLPWTAVLFLSALALFCLDFRLLRRERFTSGWQQVLGLALLWGLAFGFVWCTFHPPALPLWRDLGPIPFF